MANSSSTLGSYDHKPFPDVSGLRSSALGRDGSLAVSQTIDPGLTQEIKRLEGENEWPAGTIFCVAWGTLVAHYISSEATDVALKYHESALLLQAQDLRNQSIQRLCISTAQQITQIREREEGSIAPAKLDVSISFDAEGEGFHHEQDSIRLAVYPGDGRLDLLAAARVHCRDSAEMQLSQYCALLGSFANELTRHESASSPVLSLARFPPALRAGNNPNPRPVRLDDDDSLEQERFEGQFERWTGKTPDAIALDFRYVLHSSSRRTTLTYAELNHRAALVRDLLLASVPELADSDDGDPIVALCLDKSPEMYVAQLGILKAHAAWCPIDPDWPETRKQALLEKSGASVVLTAGQEVSDAVRRILPHNMRQLRLDVIDWHWEPQNCPLVSPRVSRHRGSATQLAYKIWTSGTTGLPKGVGIEHKAAVQALRALQEAIPHDGPIKYLQFSAYVFDLSIMDCFYAWGLGGTICACPRELLLSDLASVVGAFQATHTLLTPAVMAMTARHDCPSLKVVINGGEKLTQVVADIWSVDCCLLNLYGPAEATLIAMQRRVPRNDRFKAPNIGIALPTVSCHALNSQGETVLKGSIGQLALGGFQCARGYIGDAQKTADKFVEHPQLGRVYMTGDLVRQLADNSFEYLGREDDQIKINGIRIETLEISAIIRSSHELVKDSETMALPLCSEDDVRIVNFSVLPGGRAIDAAQSALRLDTDAADVAKALRAAAQQALPSYMVPALFIIVSYFPRTSSSKIDRVALKKILTEVDVPEWEATISHENGQALSHDADAPTSAAESTIRRHVATLCSMVEDRIGRRTPLPSLGLDSIKAMILARRLTLEGFVLSVADIVRNPTIAALALQVGSTRHLAVDRLEQGRRFLADLDHRLRDPVARYLNIDPNSVESVLPTTPLQQGMLAETLRSKDRNAYWLNRVFSVRYEFSALDLQHAFDNAFATMSGCRTAFCQVGQLDLQEELPAFLNSTFVQVARRDAHAMARVVAPQLSHGEMLKEALRQTDFDPISGVPPLAVVISSHSDSHQILLRAHHSIYDARSLELLEDTLIATLKASVVKPVIADIGQALPHVIPLSQQESDERRRCWEHALKGVPTQSQSSFPHLGGHVRASRKEQAHLRVSCTLTGGWKSLCEAARALGTSARPIAQCAWATVLAAYLDSDWVILGDSVSGRAVAPGLDNVFGPLHATLAVPIRVDSNQPRRRMVDDVDEFHKSVLGHQHIPLNLIRRQLGMGADQPLFQSVFVFEAGAAAERSGLLQHVQDLDLSVEHPLPVEVLTNGTEDLSLGLVYDSQILGEQHATCFLRQFEACLRLFCCQDVDGPAQAFDGWDGRLLSVTGHADSPEIDAALQTSAESWLLRHAHIQPHAIALEVWPSFDDDALPKTVTYESLARRSRQLASALVTKVSPQAVVAVCLPRSVETYVALLATQLSGNVYLPIDEYLPSDRKNLLLQDSQAAILLVDTTTAGAFVGSNKLLLVDDPDFVKTCQAMPVSKLPHQRPDQLSYILYTSGSTGKPKGCKLTRSNLSSAIEAFRLRFEEEAPQSFANGARFLARSAEAFDVALLETFLPLRTASTIVTAPRQTILHDLQRALVVSKATHAAVVPSLFYSAGKRIVPQDVPGLRALIVGGEQIPSDIIETWGNSTVCTFNAYGPTEATIGISMSRVLPTITTSNIGKPFAGSAYAIMKEQGGRLVPTLRGQAGELCIIGPQVGAGYLNGRDSSAFSVWDGQPLYRTGDVARLTMDDEALYLGRNDDSQVKIRGARLELKEIDAVLSTPGQLQAATILVHAEGSSAPKLVTFVAQDALVPARAEAMGKTCCIDETLSQSTEELRERSRRQLPGHMQPSAILAVQYLPLAVVSGKIDAPQLRRVYEDLGHQDTLKGSTDQVASRPLTDTEKLLVECFQASALAMDSEAMEDLHPSSDLFAAGLDSFSAIALVGKLKRFGLHLSVLDLMAHPTLEGAAEACRLNATVRQSAAIDADAVFQDFMAKARGSGVPTDAVERVLPCTPMQTALIGQTIGSEQALYVSRIDVALRDDTDARRLRDAFDATIDAHAIWRTSFVEVDCQFVQVVHVPRTKKYWTDQLSPLHVVDHITDTPPVRAHLGCDDSGRLTLVLLAHHAMYDGVSLNLFLQEVERRYLGQAVIPSAATFEQAVIAIHHASPVEAQVFWEKSLDGFPFTPFPGLHSERLAASNERVELTHPCGVSMASLSSAARRMGVTPHSVLVTAFSSLYSQYVGEQDALFGVVLSGRNSALDGAHELQGPLVSTVPFRTDLLSKSTQDTDSQVQAVHSALLDIYRYQHTSLSQIGNWIKAEQVLFNTLFSFLPEDRGDSLLFENITSEMGTEFPLAVEAEPRKNGSLGFRVVFDPNLLPTEHARLLLTQFEGELSHFLNRSVRAQVGEADVQSTDLSICNPRATYPTSQEHFISLFQDQVCKRRQAVAVDFAAEGLDHPFHSLTYEELDHASTALAIQIHDRSLAPIVAVHMQRSIGFYVTVLAVWKAGKTYMPLDPALPVERLQYMLKCAQARFVITDSACCGTADQLSDDTICYDDIVGTDSNTHSSSSLPTTDLSSTAYILFTSGSTGKPKGVPVSHRALAAAILSWRTILPHSPSSRMLQLASASFDVSLIEICMPLALGFAFASAPKTVLLEDLENAFRKLRLTMADLPAALATAVHPDNVPKLEWLMSGGDAMDERVLKEWAPCGLINAWGPTEATIGNTLGFVTPASKRSLVGKAYPGSSIYVLEPETTNLAFKGCIGELVVGGPQVAEGYLGRRDLTTASFLKLSDGTPLYRTGDRGRILANGDVEVLGRISRGQVKLRGQRLELDEISAALRSHDQVEDADTLFVQHPSLASRHLISWISLKGATHLDRNRVRLKTDEAASRVLHSALTHLQRLLPSYMTPQHIFVARNALPLTPNNKIDHAALESAFKNLTVSALDSNGTAADQGEDSVPWSEMETTIRKIVAAFCDLQEEQVHRTTSFYRLGIDSISALRLVRHLREAGLPRLSVRDIMRWSSVGMLAANACSERQEEHSRRPASLDTFNLSSIDSSGWKLRPDDVITSAMPCTPLQSGMLSQTVASNGQLYYLHHPLIVRNTTMDHLHRAWTSVISSRDILRTTFHKASSTDTWMQAVHKTSAGGFELRPGVDSVALWEHVLQDAVRDPSQLLRKQPYRLTASQYQGEIAIVLSIHHALYDGNTMGLLWDDLDASLAGVKLSLRANFSTLLPALLPDEADNDHWVRHLSGYQQISFPESVHEDSSSAQSQATISMTTGEARDKAQDLEVGLRTVALLAFLRTLGSLKQTRDVVTGEIFALRDVGDGAEDALGPIFNTVATRVVLEPEITIAQLLKQMQAKGDEGRPHRRASLQAVQLKMGLVTAPFETLFDYHVQGVTTESRHLHAASIVDEPVIQYGLNVEFKQMDDKMQITATSLKDRLGTSKLQEVVDAVGATFVSILTDAACSVDAVAPNWPLPAESETNGLNQGNEDETQWQEDEYLLREIVANILGSERKNLPRDRPLASFGIDSIIVLRIASLARKKGLALSVSDLVEGRTISGSVKRAKTRVKERPSSGDQSLSVHVPSEIRKALSGCLHANEDQIETVLPALPGQIFQLVKWLKSGKRTGIFSWALQLSVSADPQRVRAAWERLRKHHSILRTTFASTGGKVYQVVLKDKDSGPSQPVEWTVSDDLQGSVRQKLRCLAASPHSLARPPASLHVFANESESVVILNISHSLYDAWSIEQILSDLEDIYAGIDVPKNSSFEVFVKDSCDRTKSPCGETFWQSQLRGGEATILMSPVDFVKQSPVLVVQPDAFASVAEYQALQQQSTRQYLPPLQYLFIAAWTLELATLSGHSRPIFGLYHSGRVSGHEEADGVAGPTLNVLPIVGPAHASHMTLCNLATAIEERASRQLPHVQTDLAQICHWLGHPDGPLFDTYVNVVWNAGRVADDDVVNRTKPSDAVSWSRLDLGSPTDCAPSEEICSATTVDDLDPAYLKTMAVALEIDFVLQQDQRHVGIGICSASATFMEGAALEDLIQRLSRRVEAEVQSLRL